MSRPGRFRPKRLRAESVEAPLEPQWKVMGEEEAQRLHEKSLAQHRRLAPLGGRWRRRMVRYVVGTAVGFGLLGWFLIGSDWATLRSYTITGIPLGALVALWRPLDFTAGSLYALAGMSASLFAGRTNLLMVMLAGLVCGCIGIALGRVEEGKRLDLED